MTLAELSVFMVSAPQKTEFLGSRGSGQFYFYPETWGRLGTSQAFSGCLLRRLDSFLHQDKSDVGSFSYIKLCVVLGAVNEPPPQPQSALLTWLKHTVDKISSAFTRLWAKQQILNFEIMKGQDLELPPWHLKACVWSFNASRPILISSWPKNSK